MIPWRRPVTSENRCNWPKPNPNNSSFPNDSVIAKSGFLLENPTRHGVPHLGGKTCARMATGELPTRGVLRKLCRLKPGLHAFSRPDEPEKLIARRGAQHDEI